MLTEMILGTSTENFIIIKNSLKSKYIPTEWRELGIKSSHFKWKMEVYLINDKMKII